MSDPQLPSDVAHHSDEDEQLPQNLREWRAERLVQLKEYKDRRAIVKQREQIEDELGRTEYHLLDLQMELNRLEEKRAENLRRQQEAQEKIVVLQQQFQAIVVPPVPDHRFDHLCMMDSDRDNSDDEDYS